MAAHPHPPIEPAGVVAHANARGSPAFLSGGMKRTTVLWVLLGLVGCDASGDVCARARAEALRRWQGHAAALAGDGGPVDAARRAAAGRVVDALRRSAVEGWTAAQAYPVDDAPASFRDVWASTRGATLACPE